MDVGVRVCVCVCVADNNIGVEGAKALGKRLEVNSKSPDIAPSI